MDLDHLHVLLLLEFNFLRTYFFICVLNGLLLLVAQAGISTNYKNQLILKCIRDSYALKTSSCTLLVAKVN